MQRHFDPVSENLSHSVTRPEEVEANLGRKCSLLGNQRGQVTRYPVNVPVKLHTLHCCSPTFRKSINWKGHIRTNLRSLRKEHQTGCLLSPNWLVQDVQICSALHSSQQRILRWNKDIQTSISAAALLKESTHRHLCAVTSSIPLCRWGCLHAPLWAGSWDSIPAV